MWIVTILSLTGVILNIYKRKECFIVWGITNFTWMIYDLKIGAIEQAVLFAIYFLLAIWGLIKWLKEEEKK